jgi:hypothetical protein
MLSSQTNKIKTRLLFKFNYHICCDRSIRFDGLIGGKCYVVSIFFCAPIYNNLKNNFNSKYNNILIIRSLHKIDRDRSNYIIEVSYIGGTS